MESDPETIRKAKATLGPYSKSREQVAYIRRVLALYVQHQQQAESLPVPLSLLSATDTVLAPPKGITHKGIYEHYFRTVAENIRARQFYDETRLHAAPIATPEHAQGDGNPLEDHVSQLKLQRKQEKLQILQRYLERISGETVASQNIALEEILKDGPDLPSVPKEVLNSFSESAAADGSNLPAVLDQMERVVLRTKLLLRREEQLLADVRMRAEQASRNIPDHARLHALNETRTELINWIETELGKAAGADEDDGASEPRKAGHTSDTDVTQQVEEIKAKYAQYVKARKDLLDLVSDQPQPTLHPTLPSPSAPQTLLGETTEPTAHLAIPHVQRLLELSRKQKGMIQHKSHLNASLSKQARETKQMLNHLTEESQLLPSHPMPGAKKGNFGEEMSGAAAERPDATKRVKPWVYAADSAKIATLEAVTERVEEGQLALEGSMKTLFEIDQLLGRKAGETATAADEQQEEEDIWLAGEPATKGKSRPKGHIRNPSKQVASNDPWSALDGSLGLIGENSPRR